MFKTHLFLVATVVAVKAETHTIHFVNRCGFGTPTLIVGGRVASTGDDFTCSTGGILGGIAYLQTGACGFNGEGCTMVETTLINPVNGPGSGSSTDITLIPPHSFSVTTGFGYYNGCNGAGADCTNANCGTAKHKSSDSFVQVACQDNNVNLVVTFCD
ncbi:Glp-like protein [Rickenella mellea]|uniref:Glp-like protein n=1 Tax=Rickenella mellea TaxID=50990 RepID=A0A4Y7PUX8_9AGAM|nr:Glp-like protein [Rickenella mellea]